MKFFILAITLMSLNAFAQDIGALQKKSCSTQEALDLRGSEGSCRIVVGLEKKAIPVGACVGLLMGQLPCIVQYIAELDGAGMRLTCGDPNAPVLSEIFQAEATTYSVSTIINDGSRETVLNDPSSYFAFQSTAVTLSVSQLNGLKTAEIFVNLDQEVAQLTNVYCIP